MPCATSGASTRPATPSDGAIVAARPVILDCDPGHDDAIAIMLAVSDWELVGLMKLHLAEMRKLKARTGRIALENPLQLKQLDALMKLAGSKLSHHAARAKGLAALFREFEEKQTVCQP